LDLPCRNARGGVGRADKYEGRLIRIERRYRDIRRIGVQLQMKRSRGVAFIGVPGFVFEPGSKLPVARCRNVDFGCLDIASAGSLTTALAPSHAVRMT
jgi:hypothetical protein